MARTVSPSRKSSSRSAPSARATSEPKAHAAKKVSRATRAANDETPARSTRATKSAASKSSRAGGSRVLWKGAITFGLVLVPVELHTAAKRQGLELDMLDKRSMDPVGYKRYNKSTGKEVPYEQIVKGYAVEKGQYVILTDADFQAANPKATQSVEIISFVDAGQIPPMYFDTPYYLVPQRTGIKVYALLMQAMEKEGVVAIANVVIATRQHLAVVIPDGEKLMLNTLRYADELRDTSNLNMPNLHGSTIKAAEMNMAQKLIEAMRGEWTPEEYHDTYHEDIMARINEKAEAGEINQVVLPDKSRTSAPRSAEVIDLMSLLQKSIPAREGKGSSAAAKPRATKTVARKAPGKSGARKPAAHKRAA